MLGLRARNHPFQIDRRGARDDVDDRETDPALFEPLHERFSFTVDAAAAPHNAKLSRYWTRGDNGLAQPWALERVWCNPPFSNLAQWVAKAWQEREYADLIVMLIPANRTEQPFWQKHVEPYRDRRRYNLRTEFVPGRPRFALPEGAVKTGPDKRPPFGLCLLIWNGWDE